MAASLYDPKSQDDIALLGLLGGMRRFKPGARRKFQGGSPDLVDDIETHLIDLLNELREGTRERDARLTTSMSGAGTR